MRATRILLSAVLLATAATPATAAPTGQEYRDAAATALHRALKLEIRAGHNIPDDFDAAKRDLMDAADELEMFYDSGYSLPGGNRQAYVEIRERGDVAHVLDGGLGDSDDPSTAGDESGVIDEARRDGQVTQEELDRIISILRRAIELKNEALDIIDAIEFRETGKKWSPNTRVGAPQCQAGDQQVAAMSTCSTTDTWKLFVPRSVRAAICKFVDADGNRLTNLEPLFEDVVQETSCKLLDKTVVRDGVVKRVVRARLTLFNTSSNTVTGSALVRVGALYR